MVVSLALALLFALLTADFLTTGRYVLIGYYGLAPLVAAAALGPARTASVGVIATAAAFAAGAFEDKEITSASVLLRIGVVISSTIVAIVVATARERRERQIAAVSSVADTTQDAILRPGTIDLPGLDVATAYHSASPGAQIGGDFIEGIDSPFGSRAILGDVRGKGLPAIRLAATVLGAFRLAAINRPDLGEVASDLDLAVATYGGDEDFVTAVIIEITPQALRTVVCGHPPPLVGPPGWLRPLAVRPALPLGLGGSRPLRTVPWHAGEYLVAYTDGLIEARDEHGAMLSIDQLLLGLPLDHPSHPADLVEELAATVMNHTGGRLSDDLAVLSITRAASRTSESATQYVDLTEQPSRHRLLHRS